MLLGHSLDTHLLSLARALGDQQHTVTLVTDKTSAIENSDGLSVVRFFRSWSFWEGQKFLPHFLRLKPQILHVLLKDEDVSGAELFLLLTTQHLELAATSCSIIDLKSSIRSSFGVQQLLPRCDLVTFGRHDQLSQMRGLPILNKKQEKAIWLPLIEERSSSLNHEIIPNSGDKVVIPLGEWFKGWTPQWIQILTVLSAKNELIFLGPMRQFSLKQRRLLWSELEKLKLNWLWIPSSLQSSADRELSLAQTIWCAGLGLSNLEYLGCLSLSLDFGWTPVIEVHQAGMHSKLWSDGQNCRILNTDNWTQELTKVLQWPRLQTPSKLSPQDLQSLRDDSGNKLSRLYQKALD